MSPFRSFLLLSRQKATRVSFIICYFRLKYFFFFFAKNNLVLRLENFHNFFDYYNLITLDFDPSL